MNRDYLAFVKAQAVAAIGQAVESLRPAAIRTLLLAATLGILDRKLSGFIGLKSEVG